MSYSDYEYYEEEPNGNPGYLFPAGLVLGAAVGPLIYTNYDTIPAAKLWLEEQFVAYLPDYEQYSGYALIALGLLVLFLLRGIIMKLWLIGGLALGTALWIPFGAHALFYAPQIGEFFPRLETDLTLMVARNEHMTNVRNLAIEKLPLPEEAIPSLEAALAQAAARKAEEVATETQTDAAK